MDTPEEAFKPPYMSFQTFWNFIAELSTKPLPPRIDRSLMASKSGTDQFNLMFALTSFGLVDDDSRVLPLLQELTAADDEQHKSILAKMVTASYLEPMRVSGSHGTAKDLEDAFRNSYPSIASADTRRKAITFFLHAARMADIELSANFPKTRSGPGAPGASRAKRSVRRKVTPTRESDERHNAPPDDVNTYTVELKTGGTMSLTVNVNPLSLRGDDRTFFYEIVDKLADYADRRAGALNKNGPSEEEPSDQPSGDGGGVT